MSSKQGGVRKYNYSSGSLNLVSSNGKLLKSLKCYAVMEYVFSDR